MSVALRRRSAVDSLAGLLAGGLDVAGRLVRAMEQNAEVGESFAYWDGTDSKGRAVSSGLYFYQITSGNFTDKMKMMMVE